MTYDTYRYLFISAACLSGVMLLITVFLFFKFKVPKIFGDITGLSAKKAISDIRNQNVQTGNKAFKPSIINEERGKLTDKMSSTGKISPVTSAVRVNVGTAKLHTQKLNNTDETTLLEQISGCSTETSVLTPYVGTETTVLGIVPHIQVNDFAVEFDITYIHTDEVIQMEN